MRKSNLVNFKKYEEFYNNLHWKPGNYLKLINYSQIPFSWFIKLPISPYVPLFFKNGEIIFFEKFALHLQVIDLVVTNSKCFCSCHLFQGEGISGYFLSIIIFSCSCISWELFNFFSWSFVHIFLVLDWWSTC